MAEVTYINIPTRLLGRWRAEWDSDDGRSEYHIFIAEGHLTVTGTDYGDGEEYVISNVAYDRTSVRFDTLMPSTGRKGHITFNMTATVDVRMTFSFTDSCIAVRSPEIR